jgi:oligopeptide transport system permease protein
MVAPLVRPSIYESTVDPLAPPRTRGTLGRFGRNKLAVFSLAVIVFFIVLALLSDAIVPFKYNYQSDRINGPPGSMDSTSDTPHLMGTDDLGRDIFSRLLNSVRISLFVGAAADVMIILVGVSVGLVAGYFGGTVDNLLMRFTDIMYAFPGLLFAMVMVATFGRSVLTVLIALGVANWVTTARLVRGQVLQVKQMDYVLGARSIGVRPLGIMLDHILPNILGPIIVLATFIVPAVMTAEAALAFLGVGIDPSIPTLGRMISSGMDNIFSRPIQILFPVGALTILALSFTFVGDGLRDALDPRTQ